MSKFLTVGFRGPCTRKGGAVANAKTDVAMSPMRQIAIAL